ncbi:MAG TPA: Pr6Pr family membrane protein [Microbacterium sp.]|uniref:Pr6Pr family membrane protein n=1 Tax=Microbacterium sp. TaxID=51671 RepID=UPI002C899612|nr:Pr6Pr family membrane protein [Microbacterium sp.]HWI31165.1 Pr6Pr family membrane protein [Microbacterium sp.]
MTSATETVRDTSRSRAYVFATIRLAAVILVVVSIVATFLDTASRATINPFNFFGYFTMQSNIITAVVLFLAALAGFMGRPQTPLLMFARACATTYIVIVGIVYNLLLAGMEGGITLEWANWVLHVAFPIYCALDWVLFSDRTALAWKRLWVVLIYPVVWTIVVIIRGATDGWVPYPFLDPATGYGSVALYAVVIFIAAIIVGAIVFALSRVRIIKA